MKTTFSRRFPKKNIFLGKIYNTENKTPDKQNGSLFRFRCYAQEIKVNGIDSYRWFFFFYSLHTFYWYVSLRILSRWSLPLLSGGVYNYINHGIFISFSFKMFQMDRLGNGPLKQEKKMSWRAHWTNKIPSKKIQEKVKYKHYLLLSSNSRLDNRTVLVAHGLQSPLDPFDVVGKNFRKL